MNKFTAEIDGETVEVVTTDGTQPWRRLDGQGGYWTNERAVCNCGRVCECAGDRRCNVCQARASVELKESVRLAVAGGVEQRRLHARIRRGTQRALLSRR